MDDPGNLANLHDLALPQAVSFWPPAPGVAILFLALLACLVIALWQLAMRYHANAFRREATREIAAVDPALGDAAVQILAILKRVALVLHPRSEVAPLTGDAFVRFLAKTGAIEVAVARPLAESVYDPRMRAEPGDIRHFAEQAIAWVRRER